MKENNAVKEQQSPKKIIVLLILSLIALIITNGYLAYGTIDALTATGNGASIGVGAFFAIGVIIIGGIGNGLAFLLALIGLIISITLNKKGTGKGKVIPFSILIALPIILELLFILIMAIA